MPLSSARFCRAFTACFLGLFLLLGGAAPGFSFALNGYRWPDGTQIAMHLQLTHFSGALQDGSASWNASAADALNIWNQYVDTVQFVAADPSGSSGSDGANEVLFSGTIYGDSWPTGVLAVTIKISTQGSVFTETDVLFNDNLHWDSYRGPLQGTGPNGIYDFHRVALHEFGHVAGLAHPNESGQGVYAIMNSFISDFDHLLEDDIAGAKSLYGLRFTSSLPLPALQVGSAMSYQLGANNRPTSYVATGLPAGLKLDPTSGVISGVPTTTGTYAAFLTAHGARGDLGATVGFVVWPDAQKAGIPVGAFAIRAVELLNDPQRGRLYARTNDNVVVIDVNTLSILQTLPIQGSDISISADGSRLWIAKYSMISSVNLDTFAAYPDIPVSGAQEVREGANHQLYFTSLSGGFYEIDSTTGVTTGPYLPINNGANCSIELSPDRRTLISASRQQGLVARYDVGGATPILLDMASQTGDFRQFTLSHDGSKAWYQTRSQDSVRIPYSRIYRTTDLSRHPVQIDVLGTGPLAFNPDDSLAYGENDFLSPPPTSFKAELHICDPISGAILSKMDLPLPSEKILVDSSNRYLFAATSESYSGGETKPLRVYVAFPPIVRSPAPAPKRLGNVSTRAFVQDNENVEIGGFIIQGDRPKKVVLRAMGPSLAKFGLPAVPDPVLELHDSAGMIATNDNWIGNEQQILASGLEPPDDREAALVTTLSPGAYTAIVRGTNGLTGTALFELYDVDPANSRLSNISTRSRIGSDDQALIGGFIVQGDQITKVVVRAIGPSLTNFGVAESLADPMLEVHDGNGVLLAQDDDWRMYQEQQLTQAGLAPSDDRESAMLLLLQPGAYTAIVRGKNNGTGVGLVEVYNLDAN